MMLHRQGALWRHRGTPGKVFLVLGAVVSDLLATCSLLAGMGALGLIQLN
jgi:hypothetical protein